MRNEEKNPLVKFCIDVKEGKYCIKNNHNEFFVQRKDIQRIDDYCEEYYYGFM